MDVTRTLVVHPDPAIRELLSRMLGSFGHQVRATATGEEEVDNDDLRQGEAAYIVVTQEGVLQACGDLMGHATGAGAAPGAAPAPGSAPGAAMPADSVHR